MLRMKSQADENNSECSFQVGDLVFLKLQLYVQSSLAPIANRKLAFKFFGPFKILSKIDFCRLQVGITSFFFYSSGCSHLPAEAVGPTPTNEVSESIPDPRPSSTGSQQMV